MLKIKGVALAALTLALAGCQGGGLGGLGGGSAPTTQVSYAGNGAIEVVSTDPRPITRVEVVGPAGPIPATVSGHRETVDPNPYSAQMAQAPLISPFFGVGFGAGRWSGSRFSGSGTFIGLPPYGFGQPFAPGPPAGGEMRSTARVTFDDPAAYQRQWQNARVRVHFGDGDAQPTELPAPAPAR
jgi:hypothetical protein